VPKKEEFSLNRLDHRFEIKKSIKRFTSLSVQGEIEIMPSKIERCAW